MTNIHILKKKRKGTIRLIRLVETQVQELKDIIRRLKIKRVYYRKEQLTLIQRVKELERLNKTKNSMQLTINKKKREKAQNKPRHYRKTKKTKRGK